MGAAGERGRNATDVELGQRFRRSAENESSLTAGRARVTIDYTDAIGDHIDRCCRLKGGSL